VQKNECCTNKLGPWVNLRIYFDSSSLFICGLVTPAKSSEMPSNNTYKEHATKGNKWLTMRAKE